MTLPSVIRVFFAIDLPQSTKEKLGQLIGVLKKKSKSNAIRWTKADNLHITLQFLPELRTEDLRALLQHVRENVKAIAKNIEFTFGALHLFPNPYRPRVIVLDLTKQEELALLSQRIGQGIQTMHYAVETRPFRGHLTLGRIKQPQKMGLDFLSHLALPEMETISVTEVILFRSEPQPEGSVYTLLDRIKLCI